MEISITRCIQAVDRKIASPKVKRSGQKEPEYPSTRMLIYDVGHFLTNGNDQAKITAKSILDNYRHCLKDFILDIKFH